MAAENLRAAGASRLIRAAAGAAIALALADVGPAIGRPFLGTTWQGVAYPSFSGFFTQLTPENDGKWGSVEPSPGTFNWSNLSAMYALAAQRGMLVKQHNMIWSQQQPYWVNSVNATTAERKWFSAYANEFSPNLMDVVNEPLDGSPSYASGLPDGGTSSSSYGGFGWVVQAYQLARTDFPNATLLINDYGILASATKTAQYMSLINVLKSKGLIDGIGLEAHGLENFSSATIQSNLNKLDTLDLPIYISEYDLNQTSDQAQLTQMQTQFPIFYTNSMVQGVTLWDFAYGHTWQPNANLLYANGNPRPAMQWLDTVSNTVTVAGALSPGDGGYGTLQIQNLALANSSKLDFILNVPNVVAGTGGNSFIITTDVTLGSGVAIDITPGADFGAGIYSLLSFSGALSNSADLSSWTVSGPAGFNYQLTDSAGLISLNVAAVPEPAALGLLASVIGSFLLLARPRSVENIT